MSAHPAAELMAAYHAARFAEPDWQPNADEGAEWVADEAARRIAKAWDEGYETRAATLGWTNDPNPYRGGER